MRFTLNGRGAEIPDSMSEDRLLWVLRDHFSLNGPRYGCGVSSCGACAVHVDGQVERACMVAAKDVAGTSVVTLEGLGANYAGGLHPVQRAWIEASAAQCGYCQNGQVMTAAALLDGNPAAGEAEFAAAMDAVVCRCGTQPRIRRAIDRARAILEESA